MFKVHRLKCWPEYFAALKTKQKTFEFRFNDRDYHVGDVLEIYEWNPDTQQATGNELVRIVSHITQNEKLGVPKDYVIMSLHELSDEGKLAYSANKLAEELMNEPGIVSVGAARPNKIIVYIHNNKSKENIPTTFNNFIVETIKTGKAVLAEV